MNRYEYRPVEELKPQDNFVKAICFKPKKAPIICLVIGAALMIVNSLVVRLLGTFFIMMALAVIMLVKDYKVVDIFDQGVMIYGDEENKTALFIPYDEIRTWSVHHENGHDTISFLLDGDQLIIKDSFEADTAFKVLNRYAKEKEERYQKAQNQKPLNIPETFDNIRRKAQKK